MGGKKKNEETITGKKFKNDLILSSNEKYALINTIKASEE